ncbi:MAG: hypothetical protein J5736_02680, partial [Bacilli bacterium]|nr:hypothetical protein [Bacilli bacterium]
MKAFTNILMPSFNRDAIDDDFDFFQIKTDQRYFPKGARILDIQGEGIKFKSVVFENGRSIYAFCQKGEVQRCSLAEAIGDGSVTISQVYASGIEDRILLKLFLYSLNCPSGEGASFNNLAGKFYVYVSGLNTTGKTLRVLSFDVGKRMELSVNATCFTPASQFPREKIKDEPKYAFSNIHLSFKRVYHAESTEILYVRKIRFGKKTEIPFLKFNKPEKRNTKAFWAYKVLDWLRDEYGSYLSISLKEAEILEKVTARRDADFAERSIANLSSFPCQVVNLIGEEGNEKAESL